MLSNPREMLSFCSADKATGILAQCIIMPVSLRKVLCEGICSTLGVRVIYSLDQMKDVRYDSHSLKIKYFLTFSII